MTTIIEDRLRRLDTLTLLKGAHKPDGKMCAMEAVAWLAGESWSDHPTCVSPVLAAFVRSFNDRVNDETRQRLKSVLPRLIGTAGDREADTRRGYMAVDWAIRVITPMWVEAAGDGEVAAELRALPEIDNEEKARTARAKLVAVRGPAYAYAAAAAYAYAAAAAAAAAAAYADAKRRQLQAVIAASNDSAFEFLERLIDVKVPA